MQIDFFPLGSEKPSMAVGSSFNDVWGAFCQLLVRNEYNMDVSEDDAWNMVELVQMDTANEDQYIEAIKLDGKLIGSCGEPFLYPLDSYVEL